MGGAQNLAAFVSSGVRIALVSGPRRWTLFMAYGQAALRGQRCERRWRHRRAVISAQTEHERGGQMTDSNTARGGRAGREACQLRSQDGVDGGSLRRVELGQDVVCCL